MFRRLLCTIRPCYMGPCWRILVEKGLKLPFIFTVTVLFFPYTIKGCLERKIEKSHLISNHNVQLHLVPSPWVIRPKGYLRTSHWLSSIHWAGSFRLPCPLLLCVRLARPSRGPQDHRPLGFEGGASLSIDLVVSVSTYGVLPQSGQHTLKNSTAMCSP